MLSFFGIMGITDRSQITGLKKLCYAKPPKGSESLSGILESLDRKVMIGIHMNTETLHGLETKYPRHPLPAEIANIFIADPLFLNTIIYHPKNTNCLAHQLSAICNISREINAIVLDCAWPDPTEIQRFKQTHPSILVILRITPSAFYEAGNTEMGLRRRILSYDDSIAGVVISHTNQSAPHIALDQTFLRIYNHLSSEIIVGLMGALSADGAENVRRIVLAAKTVGSYTRLAITSENSLLSSDGKISILESVKFLLMGAYALRNP